MIFRITKVIRRSSLWVPVGQIVQRLRSEKMRDHACASIDSAVQTPRKRMHVNALEPVAPEELADPSCLYDYVHTKRDGDMILYPQPAIVELVEDWPFQIRRNPTRSY